MKNIVVLVAFVATCTAFSIESKSLLLYSETYASNVDEENAIKVRGKRPESVSGSAHASRADDQRPVGIIGGHGAHISQFPYQVALLKDSKKLLCGGSILNKRFILTAAHCVKGQKIGRLSIRAGSSMYSSGGQLVPVSRGFFFNGFSDIDSRHDVGILKLKTPLKYNTRVQAIKLGDTRAPPADASTVTVTGWGETSAPDGTVSEVLRTARFKVVNHRQCSQAYKHDLITEDMFCAAAPGNDTCKGDSGGPAVNEEGKQVGIVSWARGCADPRFPGVYTNLADKAVRRFIDNCLRIM